MFVESPSCPCETPAGFEDGTTELSSSSVSCWEPHLLAAGVIDHRNREARERQHNYFAPKTSFTLHFPFFCLSLEFAPHSHEAPNNPGSKVRHHLSMRSARSFLLVFSRNCGSKRVPAWAVGPSLFRPNPRTHFPIFIFWRGGERIEFGKLGKKNSDNRKRADLIFCT